tara:strand:+ start:3367 stop:4830 length:1464 start_codon:yes stop_codon:yes gene_type:complete
MYNYAPTSGDKQQAFFRALGALSAQIGAGAAPTTDISARGRAYGQAGTAFNQAYQGDLKNARQNKIAELQGRRMQVQDLRADAADTRQKTAFDNQQTQYVQGQTARTLAITKEAEQEALMAELRKQHPGMPDALIINKVTQDHKKFAPLRPPPPKVGRMFGGRPTLLINGILVDAVTRVPVGNLGQQPAPNAPTPVPPLQSPVLQAAGAENQYLSPAQQSLWETGAVPPAVTETPLYPKAPAAVHNKRNGGLYEPGTVAAFQFEAGDTANDPASGKPYVTPRGQQRQKEHQQRVTEMSVQNAEKRKTVQAKRKALPKVKAQMRLQKETDSVMLNAVTAAKGLLSQAATGKFGAVVAFIKNDSDAAKLQVHLKTLKGAIARDALVALKAAGGTLGALSEKELELLERARGELDAAQDPKEILRVLLFIEKTVTEAANARGGAFDEDFWMVKQSGDRALSAKARADNATAKPNKPIRIRRGDDGKIVRQ